MAGLSELKAELIKRGSPAKAKASARFFKTGIGEYGEGDQFIGLTVPRQRQLAKEFGLQLSLAEIGELIQNPIHEFRLTALLCLVNQYQKAVDDGKAEIVEFYLKQLDWVNNWDLVDSTAPYILGNFLLSGGREVLYGLAKSDDLWRRRVAIVSTLAFIKVGQFDDTLAICEELLADQADLIHKACGWMLREVGKKAEPALINFLDKFTARMPRTMLRYAIERLSVTQKAKYLAIKRVS